MDDDAQMVVHLRDTPQTIEVPRELVTVTDGGALLIFQINAKGGKKLWHAYAPGAWVKVERAG